MRFSALDSWRGIAALIVALSRFHADGRLFQSPLVVNSYLFVDFFFVLSGFVIAHAYFAKVTDLAGLQSFAIRRFGRLWPLHALMLGLFIAYETLRLLMPAQGAGFPPFTGPRAPSTIPAELGFLTTLGYGPTGWNHPSWSISAEFWTYLLFGLVCLFARSLFAWAAALMVVIGLGLAMAMSPSGMDITFNWGLARCVAGFFTGTLTYFAWVRLHDRVRLSPLLFTLAEAGVVALALGFVWSVGTSVASFAAPAVFAALVLVFAFEGGALSRLLRRGPFLLLGELSYSIYMVALFTAIVLERVLMIVDGKLGRGKLIRMEGSDGYVSLPVGALNDAASLAFIVTVVLVSLVTFRLVEAPGRRFFNRLSERRMARGPLRAPLATPGE